MEVNFLNQKPCILSWCGVFQVDIFLRISPFGPSSSHSKSLVILFIHSAFSLCFWLPYFLLLLVVGIFSCHLLSVLGRIFFRYFGMSYFVCIVLPFIGISLIFLLSPGFSGLVPQVVLLCFFFVLSFSFCLYMFQRFSFVLSFWLVFLDFLLAFLVEFPILVLIFCSCFLKGSQSSHKLISLQHGLIHLIWLYYSLIYKIILDLFYWFPSYLFSILFLNYGKVVFSLPINLFKFSWFTFCSCVSVCSGLLDCALFGWVMFAFSEIYGSFRLGWFSLIIPDVSGTVLLSCSLFIFWCISSISSQKTNLSLLLSWLDRQVFDVSEN